LLRQVLFPMRGVVRLYPFGAVGVPLVRFCSVYFSYRRDIRVIYYCYIVKCTAAVCSTKGVCLPGKVMACCIHCLDCKPVTAYSPVILCKLCYLTGSFCPAEVSQCKQWYRPEVRLIPVNALLSNTKFICAG